MRLLNPVRIAGLLVAVCTIAIGIVGIASPNLLTAVRQQYFATPVRLYSAVALRVAMGVVVILVAPTSRAPKTLRALGAVMCMQALTTALAGPEHGRAILEWEAQQRTAILRLGAAGALVAGSFMAFAVMGYHRSSRSELTD